MRTPAQLTEAFRSRGLKVTPQRQCIFRVLYGDETHPTAEAVYQAVAAEMPTISLRTVYQTLNDLTEMGELNALDVGFGAVRFDPNLGDHHHLVCSRCGRIRDVVLDVAVPVAPGTTQLEGFEVHEVQLVLRGLCADCQTESPPTPPKEHLHHV